MTLFLSSFEYSDFQKPKKIITFHKMRINPRNVLVVDFDEPVIGQKYGLGGLDIRRLFLVNRFDEESFNQLEVFPIEVHVLIPKNAEKLFPESLADLQNIAWASIYDNEADAEKHLLSSMSGPPET